MSSYEEKRAEIIRNIIAQKSIYKFRMFLYSLNKDIRNKCFMIARDFIENELNNETVTVTERERIQNLLNHWQWHIFDTSSTNWWSILSYNHAKSLSLMSIIDLWIDDIHNFDPEAFETSTDGIR